MTDFDATLDVNGREIRCAVESAETERCKVPQSLWSRPDCVEYLKGETVYVLRAREVPALNFAAIIHHDDGWTFEGRVVLIKADLGDVVIHVTDDRWPDFHTCRLTSP